jgi:hypothetical protein
MGSWAERGREEKKKKFIEKNESGRMKEKEREKEGINQNWCGPLVAADGVRCRRTD